MTGAITVEVPHSKATLDETGNQIEKNGNSAADRIKHPLENVWSFWLYTNTSKNWEDNLVEITTFDTVEDYWCLYHHTKLPTELANGQDYSVFKKGVQPMWEDPANRGGGRWLITFKGFQELDRIWGDTVLMMIGENFGAHNHLVKGAVVNVRPKTNRNKIGLWVSDKNMEAANKAIGLKLKQIVGISWKLSFYAHNSNTAMYTI